jgi:hypothetical protein
MNAVHVLMRDGSLRSNLGGLFIWIVGVDIVEDAQTGILLVRFSHIVLYFYQINRFVSSSFIVFDSCHFCCRCCVVVMLYFDKGAVSIVKIIYSQSGALPVQNRLHGQLIVLLALIIII